MGKLYSLISALLLAVGGAYAAPPDSYEWWFDNDVSSAQTGGLSGQSLDFQLDVSALPSGLHSFNCRLQSSEGEYGSVFRKRFFIADEFNTDISYEYWFDNDYTGKVDGDLDSTSRSFDIDLPSMEPGLHYFHCRLNRNDSEWGAIYRKLMFITPENESIVAYECWLDDLFYAREVGQLTAGTTAFIMDLDGLQYGLHRLCYRLMRVGEEWGPVYSNYFFVTADISHNYTYEYWFDTDTSAKVEGKMNSATGILDIDIPTLSPGLHFFNCRLNRGEDEWGSIYRKVLFLTFENNGVESYECWLDDNLETKQTGKFTAGVADFTMDLDGLQYGLHRCYYRLLRTDGTWGPVYCKAFFLTSENNGAEAYEYWMDEDYAGRETGRFTAGMAEFTLDMDGYEEGMHMFSYRLKGHNGEWSPVYPTYFYVIPKEEHVCTYSYEYWLDDDYAGKVTGAVEPPSISFEINLPTLSPGLHFFNCRLNRDETEWGAVYRKVLLVPGETDFAVSYECWLDDDYRQSRTGEINDGTAAFIMDLWGIMEGLHSFRYRLMNNNGEYGPVHNKYFYYYRPTDKSYARSYEYWLDDDYDSRLEKLVYGNPDMFEIDLSGLDMRHERHWFNLRVRDNHGNLSAVYRKLINNPDVTPTPTPASIIGYRHYANGIELEHVELTPTGIGQFEFEVTLPDKELLMEQSPEIKEGENVTTFTVRYVIQLESDRGWMPPVYWDFDIDIDVEKPICKAVRVSYNGRYLTLETDEENAEILYSINGAIRVDEATYTEPVDMQGLGRVTARTVKPGYQDSEEVYEDYYYYADEEHFLAEKPDLLESAFEWDEHGVKDTIESFSVEAPIEEEDFEFIRRMRSLRHLSIEKGYGIDIPDGAFFNSKLISISLPEDLRYYGEEVFSGASNLSSVIWNSRTQKLDGRLTGSIANPNVLIYVPVEGLVTEPGDLNIVTDGRANRIELHYGYPYYAARDFHADDISLTREFTQETEIGVSQGWETLVLPFTPDRIVHEQHGAAVPFAAWDGNKEGMKPFWLYNSTADGWEMSASIEEGIPYIIAMPNNPEYVESFNLPGKVTFSATDTDIVTESNSPYVTPWIEGTEFVGTFMPVEESDILSLNVHDTEGTLLPGSTFVPYAETLPFGAYVRNAYGRKQMPVFGNTTGILIPAVANDDIIVMSPAPGTISISSTRERRVQVITSTGVIMHTLDLNPGDTQIVEGLPKDLYIVAGAKVLVR